MSKYFVETVRLQSEIKREWIREIRGDRDYKGLRRAKVAHPVWPAHQPCRYPGETSVYCSLIEQKEREDSSCQICHRVWDKRKEGGKDRVANTERKSDSRRREEKWQTCWCCRDHLRACRMAQASAEKLEHTGPAEKERVASVPQREQLARTPEPPLPKGKGTEPSVQSTRS